MALATEDEQQLVLDYSVTEKVMRLERFAKRAEEALEAAPRSALARKLRAELTELRHAS